MTYGKALKKWRDAQGWSQAVAAAKVGVTQSAFASWEVDRVFPDLGNALAIDKLTNGEVPARLAAKPRRTKARSPATKRTGTDG